MAFFKCKVSRTVFTDDLKTTRVKEDVYVEAKDEREAKTKAGHPKNWLRFTGTLADKSSFLLTVEECRRLAKEEEKALRPVDPGSGPTLSRQSPFGANTTTAGESERRPSSLGLSSPR
jgi:hypothetical protein